MFIKRTNYEKAIREAEERGTMKEQMRQNTERSFDALNTNMWNQFDKMNGRIDSLEKNVKEYLGKREQKK